MKATTNKIKAMVTLLAITLLATVGLSAQNYDDDIYYIPSKDEVKKKHTIRTERTNTYRKYPKKQGNSFDAAQERYVQALENKQNEANSDYDDSESWIQDTQGLAHKRDLNKKISLYNRGKVTSNAYYDGEYNDSEYSEPMNITYIYIRPNYLHLRPSMNWNCNKWYPSPYPYPYAYYYNGFYNWEDYYYYYNYGYNHYYDSYYSNWYYRSHWYGYPRHYWGGWYAPNYYYGYYDYYGYYNPYNYYPHRYYYKKRNYGQRPVQYSSRTGQFRRNSYNQHRGATSYTSASSQRGNTRGVTRVRRYSDNITRNLNTRFSPSHSYSTRRSNYSTSRPSSYTRSATRTSNYRRSPNTATRRRTTITPRRNSTSTYYRRSSDNTSTYRRSSAPRMYRSSTRVSSTRRSTPSTYRSSSSSNSTRRSSSSSSYRTSTRSSYAPSRSSSSSSSSSSTRRTTNTSRRR